MIALVTGASQGIGRATALAFARRGVDVALVARTATTLASARDEVAKIGVRAIAVVADVGVREHVDAMYSAVIRDLGTPHIIVHAAGIVRRVRLENMTDADWDDVIAANLRGLFLVSRAFVPDMKAQAKSEPTEIPRAPRRIVVVGSISSTVGTASLISYCAAKWGALGFTKALAEELRGTGIAAMCVMPGSVDTQMLVGSGFEPQMSPEDVAGTLVYAALDAPAAMNGSAIEVFGP